MKIEYGIYAFNAITKESILFKFIISEKYDVVMHVNSLRKIGIDS